MMFQTWHAAPAKSTDGGHIIQAAPVIHIAALEAIMNASHM
jgi:hypothetical protein